MDDTTYTVSELESVANMVSNNVFFLQKQSKPTGRWNSTALPESSPAERVLPNASAPPVRKTNTPRFAQKDSFIPPSIRKVYRKLRDTNVFTAEAPVFSPDADYSIGVVGDAWRQILGEITLNSITDVDDKKTVMPVSVPPSFVEHEIIQLQRGRKSKGVGNLLDDCAYGTQCAALTLTSNNKPLHPYLTVSQQLDFDTTGTKYPGPCLLCIRRTITSVAMLYKHDSIGVDSSCKMPMMVPFYNTIDEAGGYNRRFCLTPSNIMFLPGPVVMYNTGHLRFVPTSTDETGVVTGYVDQGAMIYNPTPPLN